jgi:signal transduction histidine kinase
VYHLRDIFGAEALRFILAGVSEYVGGLSIGVVELDETDRGRLRDVARPHDARHTRFCAFLRNVVDPGQVLCSESDCTCGWGLYDRKCVAAERYFCHMGCAEYGVVIRTGNDYSEPITCGQVNVDDERIEQALRTLPERLRAKGIGATKQHVRELARLKDSLHRRTPQEEEDIKLRLTEGAEAASRIALLATTLARDLHALKGPLQKTVFAVGRIRRAAQHGRVHLHRTQQMAEAALEGLEEIDAIIGRYDYFAQRGRGAAARPLSLRWVPLRSFLDTVVGRWKGRAWEQRRILVRRSSGVPDLEINVDWDVLMRQAMDNLLANAVKFSFSGRALASPGRTHTVDVGARMEREDRSSPDILRITVDDYGLQIHPGDVDRIFEDGTQGRLHDPRRFLPGAGKGLYLARLAAREHGGDVTAWCQAFDDPQMVQVDAGSVAAGRTVFALTLPGWRFRRREGASRDADQLALD